MPEILSASLHLLRVRCLPGSEFTTAQSAVRRVIGERAARRGKVANSDRSPQSARRDLTLVRVRVESRIVTHLGSPLRLGYLPLRAARPANFGVRGSSTVRRYDLFPAPIFRGFAI